MIDELTAKKILNDDTKYIINVNKIMEMFQIAQEFNDKFNLSIPGIPDTKTLSNKLLNAPLQKSYTIKELFEYFSSNDKNSERVLIKIIQAIMTGDLKKVE